MSTAVPVYIRSRGKPLAALLDVPAGRRHPVAVLVCSPWGWDEVASYRCRREWAERLAAAGHHVLRFDLPGVGDSAGSPREPDQLDGWVAAVEDCARWLRESTASTEVAALGLGLGGLIAREAIARGAPIAQLALWGSPARGRSFVREARAFSGMQRWDADEDAAAGGIEAGGFLLSGETLESISDWAAPPSPPGLRRVLLLARDGLAVDEKTKGSFAEAGAEVREAEGDGWADFVVHPEQSVLPEGVARTVADWLAPDPAVEASGDPQEAPAPTAAEVGPAGEVEERPWIVDQGFGSIFGVLSQRRGEPSPGRCVLFLNAGAVRHTGPDRLWVELARAGAEIGIPCLRVDLEGIGESGGERVGRGGVGDFYVAGYERQVGAVLDSLEAAGIADRFMLVGLCAGGYLAYRAARTDRRVERAMLINAGALVWEDDMVESREARKLRRIFSWRWWRRLLSGQIRPGRIAAVAGASLRRLRRPTARPAEVGFDAEFDALARDGTRLTLAFSEDELLATELADAGIPARIGRWPTIRWEELPGGDHTLRPLRAQAAASALVLGEVRSFAEDSGRPPGAGSPQSP